MPRNDSVARLRALLDGAGADYAIHASDTNVPTAEAGVEHGFGTLRSMAPTLILRTENGLLAAIVGGDRRLVYKAIKKKLGLKDVSMANPEQVQAATGAAPGWVCLINPGMTTILDESMLKTGDVYGGCGVPGYSLQISVDDLVRITSAAVFDFTKPKG